MKSVNDEINRKAIDKVHNESLSQMIDTPTRIKVFYRIQTTVSNIQRTQVLSRVMDDIYKKTSVRQ